MKITTAHLELVPASLDLIRAELHSHQKLASALGVRVPDGWPPGEYDRPAIGYFESRLTENPENAGWYNWYAILPANRSDPATLIGSGGFFGPPTIDHIVEIGYSIMPVFEGIGYASEILTALVRYAFSAHGVERIIAHTTPDNIGSVRVLEKAGFRLVGPGKEPDTVEYQCGHEAAE